MNRNFNILGIITCLLVLLLNYQIAHAQQNLAQEAYTILNNTALTATVNSDPMRMCS